MNDGVGEVTLEKSILLREKSLPDYSIIATFEGLKFFSLLYLLIVFYGDTVHVILVWKLYLARVFFSPHEHSSLLCGCKALNQVT